MPQSRSGRITRTGGRGVAEGGEKQSKKTFIVKVPSKAQTDDANSVFESEAMDAEAADDTDFTQTIILQNRDEGEEGARGDTDQTDNLADFELNNIPMEMAVDGGKTDKSDLLSSYLLADHINLNNTSIGLDQAGGIRDHVISIEENGRITIEKIGIEDEDQDEDQEEEGLGVARLLSGGKQPHTPPRFPEWWLRLSSTLLSFLSTGYLVDVWLVCCDGEAVPAHQLLLSHASPRLAAWLAEAARDTQEEAVTVSLPDWDSDTVGQFVSALYQGQLPALTHSQARIQELAAILGIPLHKPQHHPGPPPRPSSIVRKKLPVKSESDKKIVYVPTNKKETSPVKTKDSVENTDKKPGALESSLGDGPMQIVQTDNGQILLLTGDLNLQNNESVKIETDLSNVGSMEDEVEKIKAVKIAEIKEQQSKQCALCYNTAIDHRGGVDTDQKFAYKCCQEGCSTDNLKTARAFNQHILRHVESLNLESTSRVCPLCYRPRIEHKNRAITDEDKGNHRGNLYKCCHCMASKLSAKKFFLHMENHVSKKHVCQICGKGYSYKHLLNEHHYKEHGEGQDVRFPCAWEGCDYTAKYKQTLHTHVMERHHGVKRKHRQEEAYKKINCPTCGKSLKRWYYHQFHKRTCSSAGNSVVYECEICGKNGFINSVTLENHKRTKHSIDRPFSCEYCPAKYATAMSLSGHRSRKHGVNSKGEQVPKKLFPCNVCGKLLTSRMKLQTHVEVIHEGRRDFKCRFCDKTFTSKSNLQIHEGSLHTGVLPYKCDFCSKMFARRNQLQTHKESQHPGHAGPFYVVEDVNSVQVEDIIIPVEGVEDGVEISVGVDSVNIMEEVAIA